MTQSDQSQDPWVLVAKILRPHGLRGTFRLKPHTRDAADLANCPVEKFFVRQNGEIVQELTRGSTRITKDLVYVKFEEISHRTDAEKYINAELVIHEKDRWDLPEGEYYIDDLAGLSLRNEDDQVIGKILSAEDGSAHDYLEIKLDEFPEQKAMLPLIPEFVNEVNVSEGYVKIEIPEGLFE